MNNLPTIGFTALNPTGDIASSDTPNGPMTAEQVQEMINKSTKSLKDEIVELKEENNYFKSTLQEKIEKIEKFEKDLNHFKSFKATFEVMGGESHFYLNLEVCHERMKKEFGDDPKKLEELDKWYRDMKRRRVINIGVALLSCGGVGGLIGSVSLHSPLVTGLSICGMTTLPVIAIGVVGGMVIVGISLAAYGVFKNYTTKQMLKTADELKNNSEVAVNQNAQ